MIEMSIKALRFARLAAEALPLQSHASFIAELKQQETAFQRGRTGASQPALLVISDELGRFCFESVEAFLRGPIDSAQWDGNDISYLRTIAAHLGQNLSTARAS